MNITAARIEDGIIVNLEIHDDSVELGPDLVEVPEGALAVIGEAFTGSFDPLPSYQPTAEDIAFEAELAAYLAEQS